MTFDSFDQIGNTNPYDVARVYTDSSFSHEFPTSVTMFESDDGSNALYVAPADPRVRDENGNDTDEIDLFHLDDAESDEFVPLGRWYGSGGYYLVRYIGSDGKKLDKPEVTYFTVANDIDKDENALAEPDNVQVNVTDTGTLSISWDPVEGADHYEVYLSAVNETAAAVLDRYTYDLLASTQDTSIDTADYDTDAAEFNQMMQDDGVAGTFQQNGRFDELLVGESEDEILENRQDAASGQQGPRGCRLRSQHRPCQGRVHLGDRGRGGRGHPVALSTSRTSTTSWARCRSNLRPTARSSTGDRTPSPIRPPIRSVT